MFHKHPMLPPKLRPFNQRDCISHPLDSVAWPAMAKSLWRIYPFVVWDSLCVVCVPCVLAALHNLHPCNLFTFACYQMEGGRRWFINFHLDHTAMCGWSRGYVGLYRQIQTDTRGTCCTISIFWLYLHGISNVWSAPLKFVTQDSFSK